MKKGKELNFFFSIRLDQEEESASLSGIYDLSMLNKVKEVIPPKKGKIGKYFENIFKKNDSIKLDQDKKIQVIQVVKKAILSANLKHKWNQILQKKLLIVSHLFMSLTLLICLLKYKNENKILNGNINNTNITLSINSTFNLSETMNITDNLLKNSYVSNETYINSQKFTGREILLYFLNCQIFPFLLWLIYGLILIPEMNEINDIIFKFTNYLLLSESYKNEHYFYYLMEDYSILISKKDYALKHNEKFKRKLKCLNYNYIPEKNIFLYGINIIKEFSNDEIYEINYSQLMPKDDLKDIKILINYMEHSLDIKTKLFVKRIAVPTFIFIFITIFYYRAKNEVLAYIFILIIILIVIFIELENNRKFQKKIDYFIDNYNEILIQKKRFIYKKNNLIMYLALKDNIYSKKQIINTIEKIIKS